MTTPETNTTTIPRRISAAILSSMNAGVVPRTGIEHIVVGRARELEAILGDLRTVAEGGAGIRLISGRYGDGKSFLLQLVRSYALARNFAVMDADLSPERRLAGSNGQGVATYRELVKNLSTRTRPEGGALASALERWISSIQSKVASLGLDPSSETFTATVEAEIHRTVAEVADMTHAFDLGQAISAYWRGHRSGERALQEQCLRWLRAEYTSRAEARRDLGVSSIVDDSSWYDHLKLLASFLRSIGYTGLVVIIDEAVNLYKITHSVNRNANYEKLLMIFNDTMQGGAHHLEVLIGATPQTIQDQRRGLHSYEALRSRLEGRSLPGGLQDYSAPVLPLQSLTPEEVYALLLTLRRIHGEHHAGEEVGDVRKLVSDAHIEGFLRRTMGRLGAEQLLTPREVTREFVSLLNVLSQNPGTTFDALLEGAGADIEAEAARTKAARLAEDQAAPEEESEAAADKAIEAGTGTAAAAGQPAELPARKQDDEFADFEL